MTGDTQHGGGDAQDPLDGADVGETRTVRRSKTLHGINYEPREFFGTDRQADIRVADMELVEDCEGVPRDIRITWEADLTKRLPRNWDRHTDPVTPDEKRQHRRKKWADRIMMAPAVVLPVGISTAITSYLMQGFDGMTIDGEPMTVPPFVDLFPLLLLVFAIAVIIAYGPGRALRGKVGA